MLKYDRDVLNKAKMAAFNRSPKSGPAASWVEWLTVQTLAHEAEHHPRIRARRQNDQEAFRIAIGSMASDLLFHFGNEDAEGFMYRALNRDELSYTLVSSDSFEKLILYWGEMGWLQMTGYINASQEWEGYQIPGYSKTRRYRGTEQFVSDAQSFQLTSNSVTDHFEISLLHADLVQVRTTKGKRYGWKEKAKTIRLKGAKFDAQKAIIQRLNQAMQTHTYSLKESPAIRRLFNCADRKRFDFNLGGRFYCSSGDNWMEMPKEQRKKITIDGQATAEIDVSASHLFILYALSGKRLSYSEDPYTINGYPRDIVKAIVVAAVGAGKMPKKWPKKFNHEYKETHGHLPNDDYPLKEVVAATLARHPVLKKLKTNELDWANLQFAESECFLNAMLNLYDNYNIPSLPVHDSLIVRMPDAFTALKVLEQAYKDRFGFEPKITVPTEAWDTEAA